jgi:hypothetical protein
MTIEPRERKTSIARLVRLRPDFLEVAYVPGCMLSSVALKEVRDARRELMGNTPYAMLSLLPDDIDFELGAMNVDHLADDRRDGNFLAIAVVTRTNMIEMILKLYFSYYPLLARLLVTDKEQEARAWLDVQFEEIAHTGS